MSQFEFVSCRLAIQICIGHFPDGRARHRTFSIKNIRPDAEDTALLTVVRAVGALLAYPVTRARRLVKKRRVLFDNKAGMDPKEDAAPETRADAPERGTAPCAAGEQTKSVVAKPAAFAKITADVCLFFKTFIEGFRRLLSTILTSGSPGVRPLFSDFFRVNFTPNTPKSTGSPLDNGVKCANNANSSEIELTPIG
jgi:hypothetical protein